MKKGRKKYRNCRKRRTENGKFLRRQDEDKQKKNSTLKVFYS